MKTYHLFISHSWDYSDQYNRLNSLLAQRPYFRHINHSVPKDDPIHYTTNDRELALAIGEKLQYCDAMIVLAGVYASYSRWIKIEIELGKYLGKPIIAVQPWGNERTSKTVRESASTIIGWNVDSVVKAIRQLA